MPLQSTFFRGNARLQKCLVSDPDHVTIGSRGAHVTLIQTALSFLDGLNIADQEQTAQQYGPSTASAVLSFKTKRKIINPAYQTKPDAIVGKMTMRVLDAAMRAQEANASRLLLSFGISDVTPPNTVILSEAGNNEFVGWADQIVRENLGRITKINAVSDPNDEVSRIQQAVFRAGAGGLLVLSVGHGVCIPGFGEEGAFDLAPGGTMRIIGKNFDPNFVRDFSSPHYADKPAQSSGGGLLPLSQKDKDERNPTGNDERRRLKNFALWDQVCRIFAAGNLGGVVLFTCRIGGAPGFLRRVAREWKTTIIAYTDQVGAFEIKRPGGSRFRAILNGDKGRFNSPAPGNTNTPMGETTFPLSLSQMVVIRP